MSMLFQDLSKEKGVRPNGAYFQICTIMVRKHKTAP
jgi:hypothetical protein